MNSAEPAKKATYKVAKGNHLGDLIQEVNELVAKGFIPVGGVCVLGESGSANHEYFQAMWSPGIFDDPRFVGHL